MKADKLFYMECHLAAREYYDADEVWDKLKVGTRLKLVRDEDNKYDPNAVAVFYKDMNKNGEPRSYHIGYIPREYNTDIAKFLDMGWNKIFECHISKMSPDLHYESQIRLTIKILPHTHLTE